MLLIQVISKVFRNQVSGTKILYFQCCLVSTRAVFVVLVKTETPQQPDLQGKKVVKSFNAMQVFLNLLLVTPLAMTFHWNNNMLFYFRINLLKKMWHRLTFPCHTSTFWLHWFQKMVKNSHHCVTLQLRHQVKGVICQSHGVYHMYCFSFFVSIFQKVINILKIYILMEMELTPEPENALRY